MIEKLSGLGAFLKSEKVNNCFVDTTILFSASYHLDSFNSAAESAFDELSSLKVAVFTNINVRAEFLENHRRVLIAECLIDFLQDFESKIDVALALKLQSHRTSYRRKLDEEKSAKMDVNQIRNFRKLLTAFHSPEGNGWEIFCDSYLNRKIQKIWPNTDQQLGLNFISLRSGDDSPYLNSIPEWEQATNLVGRYGIASNDAMILNMFLCSKIPVLLTADLEMATVADQESKGVKNIFIPDSVFLGK